ncbi:MAG: rhomboid family intramembrane serine protease [Saprospiraceae bacterium]|nr:rhomboid family intramembrane serine protease [Saprospiraceae bacterium]MBK6564746.1 rhomboid family intramembrane serine protease [Saprospiraceae bacterium]MBK7523389.1 rhomboid family intramembrane serine protease [Saprospiraceae bacterium]MBK8371621.1 rhomboid family intramembrane serine protease [Saprospiraceae bacterium]MBK8548884.1 rhomboid family intramembrane serine protease [Saprospiraceae bacterium]
MFRSIYNEVKDTFSYGNMMVKIIIINVIIYMILALTQALFPSFFANIFPYVALHGKFYELAWKPWTILTHMFSHTGFFHMAWNMIILYWFGNILGDLLGDKRIAPIYFLGGLTGALFYIISFYLFPGVAPLAIGASAAVLAVVFAAVAVAPDYLVHLILVGPVKIKYIGLFILFFDLLGVASNVNTGGHIGHLGGTFFGFLFIYLLKKGIDLSDIPNIFSKMSSKKTSHMRVEYRAKNVDKTRLIKPKIISREEEIDKILEKIKQSGVESLTQAEKEILEKAGSKN